MAKGCFVLLIGLPAAGKTTFCQKLKDKFGLKKCYNCHIITYDEIMQFNNLESSYKEMRSSALKAAEEALNSNFNVPVIIIDDNMYYRSMRYEYYQLARKHGVGFLQIYIEVPVEVALTRNHQRKLSNQVPDAVIEEMANKIQPPGKEKWEENSLRFNFNAATGEESFSTFFETLQKCIDSPVCEHCEHKTGTLPVTELQRIDLLLRKIVHKKVQEDRKLTHVYVSKKKGIYEDIKKGKIVLDGNCGDVDLCDYLEALFLV